MNASQLNGTRSWALTHNFVYKYTHSQSLFSESKQDFNEQGIYCFKSTDKGCQ